jgi:oligopeptide transport system ATP-binding protein
VTPLLKVEALKKQYPLRGRALFKQASAFFPALQDVSFDLNPGEILVIAGEPGSGKTTLARTLAMLVRPDGGKILFENADLTKQNDNALRAVRRRLQVLFSDPRTALNPQSLVGEVMFEPMRVQHVGNEEERTVAVKQAMRQVGLNTLLLDRRLTALSAGQRQEVALARLLTLRPALIICDDPAKTLPAAGSFFRLMADLRHKDGIAFIWMVGQPGPAASFADRVGILYRGHLVELGEAEAVLKTPQHPYTSRWLGDGRTSETPTNTALTKGCSFQSECPRVMPICRERAPSMFNTPSSQTAACFLYEKQH